MAAATKEILRLLRAEQPVEIRRAAVIVLGELGEKNSDVAKDMVALLADGDPALRIDTIKAVGKLKIEAALPSLLERVKGGGEEADQAAHAAARLGAKGTKALRDLLPRVAPGLRRYIASALAAGGNASAGHAALEMLLDKDPGVVEATARSFLQQIPTLSAAQRRGLTDQLLELLEATSPLAAPSEAAVVRLLILLEDPRVAEVLWERILPPNQAETRAVALQALGKWIGTPNKKQLECLFACGADGDFRVAAPALMLLKNLPDNDKALSGWLSLLRAGDKMVRLVAMEKLADRDNADVAAALLEQLSHPDRDLRDRALAQLAKLKTGRAALLGALLDADTPDHAWSLAKSQAPFVKDYPSSWRDQVFKKALAYLEKEDRRSDALFFLLRDKDAADLRDRLVGVASAHRKKKAYDKAILALRLLTRDPACAFDIRLELACCGLKTSAQDLTAQAREDDLALQQFAGLCQHHETELFPAIEAVKWLEPDDLYYLGFHFAEKDGVPRKFGAHVLHLLVKRAGKTKIGQAAKHKLRREGLE